VSARIACELAVAPERLSPVRVNPIHQVADIDSVNSACQHCGTDAAGNFCVTCGRQVERHEASGYAPSVAWIVVGVVLWLVTLPATLPHGKPVAYVAGAVFGSLMIPAIVRVLWTAAVHRGPRFWERALFSPWLWAVGVFLNVFATAGRAPHS
jgi:hypothetical protein